MTIRIPARLRNAPPAPPSQCSGADAEVAWANGWESAIRAVEHAFKHGLTSAVTVDELAQIIREVDGRHSLGAGALAEKIIERLEARA